MADTNIVGFPVVPKPDAIRQHKLPQQMCKFAAKDRGECDPDVRDVEIAVSEVMALRQAAFLFFHKHGYRALQDKFDEIEAELAPKV